MGAGKTFLASITIEYLKNTRRDQNVAVLVLYCGYNEPRSQSADNLVATLIKQILQIRPEVSEDLKKLYKESSRIDVSPKLDKLTTILRAELAKFDDCFIVVDGLDEMLDESNRKSLMETLNYGKVNIMVTSRPLDSIRELFSSINYVTCDGCEEGNFRFMYHCKQCLDLRFNLCEDCYGKGMRCSEHGQYLVKTMGSLEVKIELRQSIYKIMSNGGLMTNQSFSKA